MNVKNIGTVQKPQVSPLSKRPMCNSIVELVAASIDAPFTNTTSGISFPNAA